MLITHPCVQSGVQPSNRSGLHNIVAKKKKHRSSLPRVLASTSAVHGWGDLMLLRQLQQLDCETYKAGMGVRPNSGRVENNDKEEK
jgi:hypothetical protein